MYEQGIDDALDGTPLYHGTTAGVHESQSRLWENLVGRSRPFWEHWYARLKAAFPDALNGADVDTFYRAINKVAPSLIRTDADEVTYNLHVMLRFDLELAMLEGTLAVADLPEAWRARIRSDLGVTPADDRDGALQDVHWYGGIVGGAIQSYTLGNVGAQFSRGTARPRRPRRADRRRRVRAAASMADRAPVPPRPQVHRQAIGAQRTAVI
jgi:carboxypeptidase Taq